MSSKKAKRRRSTAERDRKLKRSEALKRDWKCSCGTKIPGGFPICLCGKLRPEPNIG